MELKPSWVTKTDPKHHPVRFLAGLWQQRIKERFGLFQAEFTPQQYGQLKCLRGHLGDLTRDVVEWIVDPVNWWHFCQQVRAESKKSLVTERPDIGFLLLRRGSALRVMRSRLSTSSAGAEFVKKLDGKEYDRIKTLLLTAYAEGKPERLTKIEAAKTLTDIQRVLIEIVDESTAA